MKSLACIVVAHMLGVGQFMGPNSSGEAAPGPPVNTLATEAGEGITTEAEEFILVE